MFFIFANEVSCPRKSVVCKNADEEVFQVIPSIFEVVQLDYRRVAIMEDFVFSTFVHIGNVKAR